MDNSKPDNSELSFNQLDDNAKIALLFAHNKTLYSQVKELKESLKLANEALLNQAVEHEKELRSKPTKQVVEIPQDRLTLLKTISTLKHKKFNLAITNKALNEKNRALMSERDKMSQNCVAILVPYRKKEYSEQFAPFLKSVGLTEQSFLTWLAEQKGVKEPATTPIYKIYHA